MQLKGSGKKKEDKDCVYLILSKLRGPFQIFASTFLSTMDALGTNFALPSLEEFCERLTREEIKLSTLESSTSSSKALVASTLKGKGKSIAQSKPTPTSPKPTQNEPKSKVPSTKKEKSNTTCTYCKKEGHPATRCWKKLQDLEETMKKHKVVAPKEHGKALNVQGRYSKSCSQKWVLDSGASHHMTSSKESFALLSSSSTSSIEVGDSTFIPVQGQGDSVVDDGCIYNVLYVPNISANLLSIYQICTLGIGKTVLFTPHEAEIRSLKDP